MKRMPLLAMAVVVGVSAAGCSGDAGSESGSSEEYPSGPVTMSVGADPGSGFDLTMRTLVDVLKKEEIVDVAMPIENHPGGASAVWTEQMVERHAGAEDQVSVTSLVMMTNNARGQSDFNVDDVTMIARLLSEYYVVVTAADSPYQDLESVLEAVVADPGAVPVGAASDDQLPFALLVDAAGGDASQIQFVAYDGGGEQSAALLSGDIKVAIGGASEFLPLIESGELRALAVVGDDRLDGLPDVPTAVEEGYDVTISNWRGIYGPPDMPEDAVTYWQDALQQAVESQSWDEAAEQNQWVTTFMVGDELDTYLEETNEQVTAAFEKIGQQ
ncbi:MULTISPECIES: tripartite tricarboxylate transporter substrate binding protein [unclassified Modestobacter]|uniref:tripartite tricarboxylate transporter substrate binding protein n=1 Tax=unclassified Modestobacter TaxID=2643866 RepID=UPI0022AAD79E|nr:MULTISPECIES: tripartite tricarboxylate transporter substrate-binding protein [unclassified Modestobacter]MCZ2826104.1 tripartite tricarboxylate transporter substrate-binding protein [Modestobacter sp. VKM Ac-2981]MCZ2852831.1 tripartite tricarboxylate transporter substrate-binding protein [Modestobacter sp. VKM Ac-2982]